MDQTQLIILNFTRIFLSIFLIVNTSIITSHNFTDQIENVRKNAALPLIKDPNTTKIRCRKAFPIFIDFFYSRKSY